ncbi:glycosyl hydrolase family 92 domain-containing protein [Trichoderma breve]|uniref:Glycosyl hydrolase family 92 domain-containing protein n=1 Tax=Trichoderma breve TaxID=2034170 RepID=A0A9W9B7R9_9HYPO|nr:glycosyl hydrolase family 92 domain-containing protein [Trichoderma breve]KAJ4854881.1 glycosyl hydrolase family 92 domain-containing protein [Trichoderma breve]
MKRPSICIFLSLASSTTALSSHPDPANESLPSAANVHVNSDYHANAGVLQYVNPLIGTRGYDPNDLGGMIPSVSPPFGMTRWTPQTRENFISQVPYNDRDRRDEVRHLFQHRGLSFRKEDERSTPYVYEVTLDADSAGEFGWNLTEQATSDLLGDACPPCPGGANFIPNKDVTEGANGRVRRRDYVFEPEDQFTVQVAMSASAHVGHLRVDFQDTQARQPYFTIQASRLNWTGHVEIDPETQEVSGSNSQRQEYLLGPDKPESFRLYFVSRFSEPFTSYGVSRAEKLYEGEKYIEDKFVGAYVTFDKSVKRVEVRTGVSYVSVEQARKNLGIDIPDGTTFESTVDNVKSAWLERLGRIKISGVNETDPDHDPRTIFYSGLFHALQYPSDYSEPTTSSEGGLRRFYSGYTDSVHEANDSYYQSWSIWDTYRAEHSLLTIFAPERVDSMMRSLLRIFDWSGRLPLWNNMIENNEMIATHVDAVIANALIRGFDNFDVAKAWDAVYVDAYVPPDNDTDLLYYSREPSTPYECRAGLTSYLEHGWVDNDRWAESASRTLDYSFDDYAAAVVAEHAGDFEHAKELRERSQNYRKLWNPETEFMQARNANGTWANESWGWTEGDKWIYTLNVMHDVGGLASLFKGGKKAMKARMDEYFAGGHNMHSNEPSHHAPYLYSAIGYPADAARQIRELAWENYNATASGLSGNEDLGQMSAWYVLSALGFYPVNPASDEYVVATPFFDEVEILLPPGPGDDGKEHTLVISAPGAGTGGKAYVKSLKVDGEEVRRPLLKHKQIVKASRIDFEMSNEPTSWGQEGTV